ncbi:hypothetical protein Poli38472_006154 [Pythium oligandrum]|uniref:Uncharacterized protein n=1 Tax=Pythium oligandrum TaxID=41045 RepID=A0A8K1FMV7_PYTOL|nr:hypothetical protein Poli38472_006154 [Pythium oligandrum]|eukprot:TMW68686.1 hypothetical protein Poli38472_006154 [Pythium oligandrum]
MLCRRWYFTSAWLQYDLRRPLHKKSPLNLHSRPFQHQWQQFIKANCKVFLDRLVQFLPPASKEETYRLKMGLCKSTNTGVRPSFDNANARTGYIVDKMNRCGNLPNVLLTEEMSDMRTDLFGSRSSRHWKVALYGGGPGFDSIGLEFLANYLRVPDQTFETIVYDNEPGWADAVSGVRRTLETLGFSRSSWEFKPCDITEDLTTAMNAGVGADASSTDLFVFSRHPVRVAVRRRRRKRELSARPRSAHKQHPGQTWSNATSPNFNPTLMTQPSGENSSADEVTAEQVYVKLIRKILTEEPRAHSDPPTINPAMVNVLSEDAALGVFLSYITRLAGHNVEAEPVLDGPSDKPFAGDVVELPTSDRGDSATITPELLASYRATMLLTSDEASEALMTFLAKKTKVIVKCVFPIFQKNSRGNLRHGCRVIDYLMRLFVDDVYDVIGRSSSIVKRYMGSMLQYIEHAPVAELFLTMICKPHSATVMRFYQATPQKKWQFFRSLSEWKILLVLAEHVYGTSYTEEHNIGAADVFVELLDRLSADENGAILLQPAAYCPELLENLIRTAVDNKLSRSAGQRTAAMKCVLRLLQRSMLEKVQGPPTSPYQSFGGTIVNLVPNQLASLREKIFELAEKDMAIMLQYMTEKYQDQQNIQMDLSSDKPLPDSAVRHTAYVVKVPFTEFRLMLVDALVELIAHNPVKMHDHFDVNVWRVLVAWFFEYAHNNLYHAAFYQLVFIALRTDNKATLAILMKKLKLVTSLIENYRNEEVSSSNKGYILQCCNAIRLQAASQSPDAFLRSFLQSHTTWRGFEAELREQTNRFCVPGLGFTVPQHMRPGMYQPQDTWQTIESSDKGIDHGSEFARSLGFVDDVAWPDDHTGSENGRKKKKNKKKGKKKSGATNGEEHEDDESEGAFTGASETGSEHGSTDTLDMDDLTNTTSGAPKKSKKKKKKSKAKK